MNVKYVGGGQYEQPGTSQYLSLLTPSQQWQDQIQLRGELTLKSRDGKQGGERVQSQAEGLTGRSVLTMSSLLLQLRQRSMYGRGQNEYL